MRIVQVSTPDGVGSGAFVERDLVITAAHVIHPRNRTEPFRPKRLRIVLRDATELRAVARLCHPKWTAHLLASADIAVLRVGDAQNGLVIPTQTDPQANARAVTVTGFRQGTSAGTVTRIAGTEKRDTFNSDDLSFHVGVSGAPIVDMTGMAIGVATRSFDVPTTDAFIGIPFLDNNLAWLVQNCATEDT